MLVASSGGHLAQLVALRSWWERTDRVWVSFDTADARDVLAGERVAWAHHPTNRHLPNLLRNARLARRVVAAERPDVVVSTGAGVALPFLAMGRAFGAVVVFLEVYDRIDVPSLTGRLVAPWVDAVALQWDAQRQAYPDGFVVGRVL